MDIETKRNHIRKFTTEQLDIALSNYEAMGDDIGLRQLSTFLVVIQERSKRNGSAIEPNGTKKG